MKKIVVSLCVLVTLGLQAGDIASDMKSMRDGLQEMQDGFLYNNSKSVVSGIDKIEKVNGSLSSKESIDSFLPQDKKKLVGVTLLSAKSLNSDLEAMREYIKQNKMLEAAALHSDVMKDCTRCHAIVRGW